MRIRKHGKPSFLSFSHASPNPCPSGSPRTRVCELNQSPWDVISFAPEYDPPLPKDFQVEKEYSVNGNGSREEPISAVESVSSFKGSWEDKEFSLSLPVTEKREKKMGSFVCCNKTDGKGWQCKKEAKEGHSLCEHHLTQLKSYYSNNKHNFCKRKSDEDEAVAYAHKGKRSSSKTSSNYYYYTVFGPLWGKNRGEPKRGSMEADGALHSTVSSSSSSVSDDDDEADDNAVVKKRARKPVKTRSLKSLL